MFDNISILINTDATKIYEDKDNNICFSNFNSFDCNIFYKSNISHIYNNYFALINKYNLSGEKLYQSSHCTKKYYRLERSHINVVIVIRVLI